MSNKPDPEALGTMRERLRENTRWAAYQNSAFDSHNAGHLQFLHVGADCTYAEAPAKYPMDNVHGMGWRYVFIGFVNFDTGEIDRSPR